MRNQKGFAPIVILVVLMILVVFAGGAAVWQKNQQQPTLKSAPPDTTPYTRPLLPEEKKIFTSPTPTLQPERILQSNVPCTQDSDCGYECYSCRNGACVYLLDCHPSETPSESICPRPTDEYGERYQIESGKFLRLENSAVVIQPPYSAGPLSVNITSEVAEILRSVYAGTKITLYDYVGSSLSGANPTYSCVEL
jgi:hypothetical protein